VEGLQFRDQSGWISATKSSTSLMAASKSRGLVSCRLSMQAVRALRRSNLRQRWWLSAVRTAGVEEGLRDPGARAADRGRWSWCAYWWR
jgi:hypothetical protein